MLSSFCLFPSRLASSAVRVLPAARIGFPLWWAAVKPRDSNLRLLGSRDIALQPTHKPDSYAAAATPHEMPTVMPACLGGGSPRVPGGLFARAGVPPHSRPFNSCLVINRPDVIHAPVYLKSSNKCFLGEIGLFGEC